MSLRGVWVISVSQKDKDKERERDGREQSLKTTRIPLSKSKGLVLFSRRFPTVEQRFKISCESCSDLYCPIPLDTEFCDEVILKCSTNDDGEFNEKRDSVSNDIHWPVYECGSLWPVVCLRKNDLFYVAVTSFNPINNKRPPIVKLLGVPAALSLLEGMMNILSTTSNKLDTSSPQLMELYQYLCMAAPFGTPNETDSNNLRLQVQFRKAVTMPKEKIPSWRPAVYKGTSKLNIRIREELRAAQYDKSEMEDRWQLYGTVNCKAELEGHPDILISLTTPPDSSHLDHLTVHPCVQSADAEPKVGVSPSRSDSAQTRSIRFSAPLESFDLCYYQVTSSLLPIRGFYQMKGDRVVELLIQLKLHDSVRNNFEYCEIVVPFYNRGTVEKIENVSPTSANICLSADKKSLVWNIGQKFPTKSLEVSLGVTLTFEEFPVEEEQRRSIEAMLCVEQNSYCELNFKLSDYTLSGVHIDTRSITTFPSVKYKLTLLREFVSSNYRIWNSHGDILGIPPVTNELFIDHTPPLTGAPTL